MSTSKKPATNAGTANRPGTGSTALANRQYVDLEQQRIAQAYIGRVVSDHFSTGAESMTSRDFLSMFGAMGGGGIATAAATPTPASSGNAPSKSHHRKATPAQQAALARARAAKAGAKK